MRFTLSIHGSRHLGMGACFPYRRHFMVIGGEERCEVKRGKAQTL